MLTGWAASRSNKNGGRVELRADLHMHTVFSDGRYTPEEVAALADIAGLGAIAVTDHDAVDAIPAVQAELDRLQTPVQLVSGTELTAYNSSGREIHILAYGFDPAHDGLCRYLERFRTARRQRVEQMVVLLQQHSCAITLEDVERQAGSGSPGRVHVARALVRNGIFPTVSRCFQELLGEGAPAYVPKYSISPEELIPLIHSWGAAAVMAHPVYFEALDPEEREAGFEQFLAAGGDGFEAYHPNVDKKLRKELKKLARRTGALITGGSDCHGGGMGRPDVGGVTVPWHFVEQMLDRVAEKQQSVRPG